MHQKRPAHKKAFDYRLETPIRRELNYARVMQIIRTAKSAAGNAAKHMSEAFRREDIAFTELQRVKVERDTLRAATQAAQDMIAQIRRELLALPPPGEHAPLVLEIMEKIVGQETDFESRDNSYDVIRCRFCREDAKVHYKSGRIDHTDTIVHEKDCLTILAQAVLDSSK